MSDPKPIVRFVEGGVISGDTGLPSYDEAGEPDYRAECERLMALLEARQPPEVAAWPSRTPWEGLAVCYVCSGVLPTLEERGRGLHEDCEGIR